MVKKKEVCMKKAFTLAEVLITLSIIGVVAALTMPALIQNHKTKETVSKLKRAYSIVSNAYTLAKNEHGEFNQWGVGTSFGSFDVDKEKYPNWQEVNARNSELFWDILSLHLNVVSECKSSDSTCPKYDKFYKLDGTVRNDGSGTYILSLNDGMNFNGAWIANGNCSGKELCGDFSVDINGPQKGPNAFGKDIFTFLIYPNAIIPDGTSNTTVRPFEDHCNMTSSSSQNGYGCAAWVIYNENMDYLRCNDLSWNGKHKCK